MRPGNFRSMNALKVWTLPKKYTACWSSFPEAEGEFVVRTSIISSDELDEFEDPAVLLELMAYSVASGELITISGLGDVKDCDNCPNSKFSFMNSWSWILRTSINNYELNETIAIIFKGNLL